MEKGVVISILLAIILIVGIFLFLENHEKEIDRKIGELNISYNESETEKDNFENELDLEEQEGFLGGQNNSDREGLNEGVDSKELPSDITEKPCGYYFSEYGVCDGVCSRGDCVKEERSCYCKK